LKEANNSIIHSTFNRDIIPSSDYINTWHNSRYWEVHKIQKIYFSFCQYIICASIFGFWLPFWYIQTLYFLFFLFFLFFFKVFMTKIFKEKIVCETCVVRGPIQRISVKPTPKYIIQLRYCLVADIFVTALIFQRSKQYTVYLRRVWRYQRGNHNP